MARTFSVERLYSLGDFKNIKLSEQITTNSDEVSVEVANALNYFLLLSIESSFYTYLQLVSELKAEGGQNEILAKLEQEKLTTLNIIKDLLK